MSESTKQCDNCDAVISKDEKTCPACKLNLEELDDNLKQLEQLEKVRDKRKAKATPTTTVTVVAKKKGLFGKLVG